MKLSDWISMNTLVGRTSSRTSSWINENCKFSALDPGTKKLPKRVAIQGLDGYVMVDQGRSGQNPDGSWSVSGTQYTQDEAKPLFNHQARPEQVSQYDGPHGPVYLAEQQASDEQREAEEEAKREEEERLLQEQQEAARSEFLQDKGIKPRHLERDWMVAGVPNLDLDALWDKRTKDQTLRVLEQQTGRRFGDDELEHIAKLYTYNGDVVRIRDVDPSTGMAEIYSPVLGEDDSEFVSVDVLKAFGDVRTPRIPDSASQSQERRKGRALRPYRDEPEFREMGDLDRDMMSRMTPNLQRYMPNVSLKADVYENFGLRRHGEPLGEQIFLDELQMFGIGGDDVPEDAMRINRARPSPDDEPLRGAWSGYVTLAPDESGKVPLSVLSEAMELASDSRPQIRAGDRFAPVGREDFWQSYSRGPVFFSSNNLFRHLAGLGYFGNAWEEGEERSAAG